MISLVITNKIEWQNETIFQGIIFLRQGKMKMLHINDIRKIDSSFLKSLGFNFSEKQIEVAFAESNFNVETVECFYSSGIKKYKDQYYFINGNQQSGDVVSFAANTKFQVQIYKYIGCNGPSTQIETWYNSLFNSVLIEEAPKSLLLKGKHSFFYLDVLSQIFKVDITNTISKAESSSSTFFPIALSHRGETKSIIDYGSDYRKRWYTAVCNPSYMGSFVRPLIVESKEKFSTDNFVVVDCDVAPRFHEKTTTLSELINKENKEVKEHKDIIQIPIRRKNGKG